MKYLKKFESMNIESSDISSNIEADNEFVVSKIVEHFPIEEVKKKIEDENDETDKETALIDMICWFRENYKKEIENEDLILARLREEYDIH